MQTSFTNVQINNSSPVSSTQSVNKLNKLKKDNVSQVKQAPQDNKPQNLQSNQPMLSGSQIINKIQSSSQQEVQQQNGLMSNSSSVQQVKSSLMSNFASKMGNNAFEDHLLTQFSDDTKLSSYVSNPNDSNREISKQAQQLVNNLSSEDKQLMLNYLNAGSFHDVAREISASLFTLNSNGFIPPNQTKVGEVVLRALKKELQESLKEESNLIQEPNQSENQDMEQVSLTNLSSSQKSALAKIISDQTGFKPDMVEDMFAQDIMFTSNSQNFTLNDFVTMHFKNKVDPNTLTSDNIQTTLSRMLDQEIEDLNQSSKQNQEPLNIHDDSQDEDVDDLFGNQNHQYDQYDLNEDMRALENEMQNYKLQPHDNNIDDLEDENVDDIFGIEENEQYEQQNEDHGLDIDGDSNSQGSFEQLYVQQRAKPLNINTDQDLNNLMQNAQFKQHFV